MSLLKNRPIIALATLSAIVYLSLIAYRYYHFAYNDWDMAFINQQQWNLLHGKFHSSLYGFHSFGGHAEFIMLLILPIFAIFQHPLTVQAIQVILFSISGVILYRLIKEDLGHPPALILAFTYLTFTPNIFAMIHDCSGEPLAPAFLLAAVYFFRQKEIKKFYASIAILLLIKENLSLMIFMIGLWGLCSKDRDRFKWGIIPAIIAIAYFLALVKWVIPQFRGMEVHSLWARFHYLGSSPNEILFKLLNIQTALEILSSPLNIQYISNLFGAFLVSSLLSPTALLPALPLIGYHLLSAHYPEKTIYYHYAAAITPFIFLATAQTIKKFIPTPKYRIYLCLFLLSASLFQLYTFQDRLALKIGLTSEPNNPKWRLVDQIPSQASTIATFAYLPALSLREELYSFHKIYDKNYQDPNLIKHHDFYTGDIFYPPQNLQYALIDFNDAWLNSALFFDYEFTTKRIQTFLEEWELIDSAGSTKLYRKAGGHAIDQQ